MMVMVDVVSYISAYTNGLMTTGVVFGGCSRGCMGSWPGRPRSPIQKSAPLCPRQKCSQMVAWLHWMFVLVTSLCPAFSDADIEFDLALMTSAYSYNCMHWSLKPSLVLERQLSSI